MSLNSQKRLGYKEITPNIEVCPESLGAMLEYRFIEHALLAVGEPASECTWMKVQQQQQQ